MRVKYNTYISTKVVDRKEELEFLEERYKTDSSEFVVLYGRRRVGKTSKTSQK